MSDYTTESSNESSSYDPADPDFLRLKKWFKAARAHNREWRIEAEEAYGLRDGDQWSPEEKAALKDQMRPMLTFNRIAPIIDSVAGYEVQNRQEVRYLPRQMGKVQVNEVLTAGAKWFRDQSGAEDEESDAFLDSVICGMGWIESRLDYEDDPDGRPVDDRVDPLEMAWDPAAKKKNLEDRRFQFRLKKYPIEDAEAMFPDCEIDELHAAWADDSTEGTEPHDQQEAKFYENDQSGDPSNNPRKEVLIVQAQWWDKEAYYRVADPQTKKIVSFPAAKFKALRGQAEKFGIKMPPHMKATRKVYKQAFMGACFLETPGASPYAKGFTINPITGKRDRNKNTFYGIVRAMRDPQAWANKFFSSLIYQFATSGKGVLAETDAVDNVRKFEEEYANAAAIKWMRSGAISKGKVLQLNGPQLNTGVVQMMEMAIQAIPDTAGVSKELMGTAEKDQPGILEFQRKQAGLTILAGFFDSLRRFRKVQGHILLHYIQHYFSDGRLIKIDGEDGAQYIPLVRDPNTEDYDVIVDDAPTSPNQKEHVWGMLVQMMPILGKMSDPVIWSEIIKYSPLPSTLTEKISQHLQQQASQPQQPSPTDQAKIAQSQSAVARNIAGAIKDLSQAGVQGPGPEEDIKKQAVASLLESGQSAQDHGEAMQQSAQEHQQALQQAAQEHQHTLQQNAQAAALAPEPTSGAQ